MKWRDTFSHYTTWWNWSVKLAESKIGRSLILKFLQLSPWQVVVLGLNVPLF